MIDLLKPVWWIITIIAILLLAMCGIFVLILQWFENMRLTYYGQTRKRGYDKKRR